MSDTQHTPWIVFATPQDPDFAYEVSIASGEIAAVYKHADAKARALLIASAPDLLAERDALKAQRDELVEALTDVIGWVSGPAHWHTDAPQKSVNRARALIAKHRPAAEGAQA